MKAQEGQTHVPGGSAVVGLGGVVPAISVAAHEQELVLGGAAVMVGARVEMGDPVVEALPLRLGAPGVEGLVCRVVPVNEAKVLLRLFARVRGLVRRMDGAGGWTVLT